MAFAEYDAWVVARDGDFARHAELQCCTESNAMMTILTKFKRILPKDAYTQFLGQAPLNGQGKGGAVSNMWAVLNQRAEYRYEASLQSDLKQAWGASVEFRRKVPTLEQATAMLVASTDRTAFIRNR
jgi:hypothetical protein